MKKLLTLFVAGLMAVSMTACGSSSNGDKPLIVASQEFNQMFMNSDGLGNNSYDKNVRDLIYGYETYALDANGEFQLNKTAIKDVKTSQAKRKTANGEVTDKTYTFTLNDGLVFNDGSPVTASDYVTHSLIMASPDFVKAEAESSEGQFLLGYEDYHSGKSDVFAGVQMIDEKTFSLTIDGVNLPYFWEYSLVAVRPDCLKVLAGDAKIASSDKGAKIDGNMSDIVNKYTTTENKTPTVTAGPYKFVSFENKQVKLAINDKFVGDPRGNKPAIKEVVIKEVSATTDMDTLINGDIDILSDQIEGDKIEKGKKDDNLQFVHYARNGLGNLPFHCDFGPTKDPAVRRGINFLIDKDTIVKSVCGGYGSTLNSDYSVSQWMYTKAKQDLEKNFKYNYAFSIEKANEEFDKSAYHFEKDGKTPFDTKKASANYLRYNDKGEVLQINHLGTENNPVTDNLELMLKENMPKAGVKFTLTRTDFSGLMDNYYYGSKKKDKDRIYHTFNMGSDFSDAPDPYYSSYATDFAGTPANPYNISDEKLDELMQDLRHTDMEDRDGFLKKWEAYEVYFNELLPMAPIYTNDRHSFAKKDLNGFANNSFQSWAQLICQMSWK